MRHLCRQRNAIFAVIHQSRREISPSKPCLLEWQRCQEIHNKYRQFSQRGRWWCLRRGIRKYLRNYGCTKSQMSASKHTRRLFRDISRIRVRHLGGPATFARSCNRQEVPLPTWWMCPRTPAAGPCCLPSSNSTCRLTNDRGPRGTRMTISQATW